MIRKSPPDLVYIPCSYFWLNWPGNSERAREFFFSLLHLNSNLSILNMKPLSVEMAFLLGIQNEIQAI